MTRQTLLRLITGLSLTLLLLLHASGVVVVPLLTQLERWSYDLRINLHEQQTVDPRIVIVDIDEHSLKNEGRWPWGRDKVAQLVDRLFSQYQVQMVGFDVLFSEPDESSGLQILDNLGQTKLAGNSAYQQALQELRPQLQHDQIFAMALQERPVVLGFYFTNDGTHGEKNLNVGMLPPPAMSLDESFPPVPFIKAIGYGANLPELQHAALAGGFIDMPTIDEDGILRRLPLLQSYHGQLYESLSLAMVRALLGTPPIDFVFGEEYSNKELAVGLEWLDVAGLRIPVNESVTALIPYRGRSPSFAYVSATDVLHGDVPAEVLRDAIVLVGTTAAGLLDLRATPVQNVYPGVEIHANLISSILDGTLKQAPAFVRAVDLFMQLIISLVLLLLFPRLPLWLATLLASLLLGAIIGINLYAWQALQLVIPLTNQLTLLFLLFGSYIVFSLLVENRNKREITRLFGQYVPPELVDEMSENPEQFGVGAQAREMTVMFSDIRDFTALSENMPPQELSQMLNIYLSEMTAIIHRCRGTVDKYIGDAIMAFWGAPLADANHAQHAVDAALAMMQILPKLNQQFAERGWPSIQVGLGINTGPMAVGNMGSNFRMAYTVMGDNVNLASRLEGLTKTYSVPIVVSENVMTATDRIVYRELDRVRVKGKQIPVQILEPLFPDDSDTFLHSDWLQLHKDALAAYYAMQWSAARQQFKELLRLRKEHLYQVYLDRIADFMETPPAADWDGVYVHTEK